VPFIGSNTLSQLIRDNQRLDGEVRDLKRTVDDLDRRAYAAELALTEAKRPQPAELSRVLAELKGFVPTLPYAPGYPVLATARDEQSFAQGLHLMLMHARSVGQAEGKAAR
jgi:hypothetical protein